jgi:isoleucyl-tRNA synthetase
MFFAQFHYPFENKELFESQFPADFIAEGIDQTRGWFYTLHNISTALFGKPAFKNIIVNELILDRKGVKMSKSLGNTVDPFEVMEKYGADATRWYLLASTPPWRTTLFNEDDIAKTVISDFFRSLTNTYAFFALYANIDNFEPPACLCEQSEANSETSGLPRIADDARNDSATIPYSERPEIDKWIISKLNSLIGDYTKFMDDYDLTKSCRAIQNFVINELSNWYIRRNRRRFWKGENDSDKIAAYQTLYEVLLKITSLIAPIAPFLSEDLYLRLHCFSDCNSNENSDNSNEKCANNSNENCDNSNENSANNSSEQKAVHQPMSVHIADMPTVANHLIDKDLERRMELAQKIVSLARFLREKSKLRIRQPLRRILIPVNSPTERRDIQAVSEIIKE